MSKHAISICIVGMLLGCVSEEPIEEKSRTLEAPASIKVSGEIAAAQSDAISPPQLPNIWRYTIAYMAPDGQKAFPGMPVLKFDTKEIQDNLIEKKAQLASKESELNRLKVLNTEQIEELQLTQEENLAEEKKAQQKAALPAELIARKDYQKHQLNAKLAELSVQRSRLDLEGQKAVLANEQKILESEIKRLRDEIEQLQTNISRMEFSASRQGVVIHKSHWNGNKFDVGDSVWGGRRIMEVADLNALVVELEIPERDLSQVAPGQAVKFRLDAVPDRQFEGIVTEVGKVVRTRSADQPAMVVDATATIESADPKLMRPGMRITAEILGKGSS